MFSPEPSYYPFLKCYIHKKIKILLWYCIHFPSCPFEKSEEQLQCIYNWSYTFSLIRLYGLRHLIVSPGAVERLYYPVLTYTSKQADKARSSNHFRNKDKQFNPYYRIHQIQLISSKVTPESKIVLALHFIYSYEGITGNQDSLFIPLVSTLVTRPLHTFTSKTLLKPLPSFTTTCLLFMEQVISIWFCCYFYLISAARHQNLSQLHWAMTPFSALKSWKC